MKKVEKSIDEMMNSISEIREDQLGELQGGFLEIGVPSEDEEVAGNFICKNTICPPKT